MCIICVKPKGIAMPDNRTINAMWQGNSDGAGIAYSRPGDRVVNIEKGFMKLKALRSALGSLQFGVDDMVVLHFRWATHGLTDEGNCHPFPLSRNIVSLRALHGQFPCAVAHNGVFGNMATHETLSDTQKFIAKVMADPAIIGNIDNPAVVELIAGYCGSSSKLAILKPGRLLLIGDFITDHQTGLVYSNHGYKPWGNAYHHVSDNGDEFIEVMPPANGIPKVCEYCQKSEEVSYSQDYNVFLCKECLEYNLLADNACCG